MHREMGRGDIGRHMLMLLGKEGEMALYCWRCPMQFLTRAAYLRHLAEQHPGPSGCRRTEPRGQEVRVDIPSQEL